MAWDTWAMSNMREIVFLVWKWKDIKKTVRKVIINMHSEHHQPVFQSLWWALLWERGFKFCLFTDSFSWIISKTNNTKYSRGFFMYVFTNPSTWAGCDTMSIFKQSLTGLNSEFFILLDCLPNQGKRHSPPYYLPIAGGRITGFKPLMQIASSKFWTCVVCVDCSKEIPKTAAWYQYEWT